MSRETVIAAWAAKCKEAEQAGVSATRIIESELLQWMLACDAAELSARNLAKQLVTTREQVEGHRTTIDQLRARLTPPGPKHGTTRMSGLHVMCPQTGMLIYVDVDYEADDSGITPLYVWLNATDISGFLDKSTEQRLIDQIVKINAETAAEIRAEARAELRAAA